jgi:hypothetical protein
LRKIEIKQIQGNVTQKTKHMVTVLVAGLLVGVPLLFTNRAVSGYCCTKLYTGLRYVVTKLEDLKCYYNHARAESIQYVKDVITSTGTYEMYDLMIVHNDNENQKQMTLLLKTGSDVFQITQEHGQTLFEDQENILACVVSSSTSDRIVDVTKQWKYFAFYTTLGVDNRETTCTVQDVLDVMKLPWNGVYEYSFTLVLADLQEHTFSVTQHNADTDIFTFLQMKTFSEI